MADLREGLQMARVASVGGMQRADLRRRCIWPATGKSAAITVVGGARGGPAVRQSRRIVPVAGSAHLPVRIALVTPDGDLR